MQFEQPRRRIMLGRLSRASRNARVEAGRGAGSREGARRETWSVEKVVAMVVMRLGSGLLKLVLVLIALLTVGRVTEGDGGAVAPA